MKKILWFFAAIFMLFLLASFFLQADLRTTDVKNNTQSQEKIQLAKTLLNSALKKQGMDKLNQFSTYEVIGSDYWKGMMGEMGNPWAWNKDEMVMRFSVGDFDGQVEVLEGDKKGFVAGIQSWNYYEKSGGQFKSNAEKNTGIIFTLAAFHYFFELGDRLAKAPFIRYAGKGKLKGKEMDKIFVSWGNEVTQSYDHYLLWIGKESGLIEATTFTTRDNPKPVPAFLYGSLRFDDYRNIDGILIPFKQTAQMMNPKDDIEDYIHQLMISKFTWDVFDSSKLSPLEGLQLFGDDKPSPHTQ